MNTSLLHHLAIIPDGNRRWARQHAIQASKLYEKGTDKTLEIIEAAFQAHIGYVTIWASSYANLTDRTKNAVDTLERMYEKKFLELATHPLIHENKIHIEVIGEWRELLKPATIQAAQGAIEATKDYTERLLTILVGYDGRRERGAATLALLADNPLAPDDVNEADELLRSYAWTGHLPDVDLILRTGAWKDPHNSASFLSFLNSETQFSFPEVLWPDLSARQLKDIINEFIARERRLGK